jgi:FtsZ-binding cell division protein ZapB
MIRYALLTIASAVLSLNGCAQTPKVQLYPAQNDSPKTSQSYDPIYIPSEINIKNQGLLEFIGGFIELPIEVQRKELAQIHLSLLQNKDDINNRMKIAMIYGFPSSRLRDISKAQILLDDLLHEKTLDNERKTLVILLRYHIYENNKLSQRSREEQKRADTLQQKADTLQEKLEDMQKRSEALQKKLDDLKEIEKTMVSRDRGARQ